MDEFALHHLPWEMFDAAQRRAVIEHGYETPEWLEVRRLAELHRSVWSDGPTAWMADYLKVTEFPAHMGGFTPGAA